MFKYVIFAPRYDYTFLSYLDVINDDNVKFISNHTDSGNFVIKLVFRVAYSRFFFSNKKKWLDRFRCTKSVSVDDDIFFIIYADVADTYINEGGHFFNYIHTHYPKAKLVWYNVNVYSAERQNSFDEIRKYFDLLVTTEVGDAQKYGLCHYPDFMSRIPVNTTSTSKDNTNDVFYLGAGKNRLKLIANIYDALNEKGLKCYFIVTDVPEKDRIERDGICYSERIDYKEYICLLQKYKCLLEVCSPDQQGSTLRATEAVIYEKKLLTNNLTLINEPHFVKENVVFLDKINSVDLISFVNSNYVLNSKARSSVGPENFFRYLTNKLS